MTLWTSQQFEITALKELYAFCVFKKLIALTASIQAKQSVMRGKKKSPSSFLLPSQIPNFTRLRADTPLTPPPNWCPLLKSRYRTTAPKFLENHSSENSKYKGRGAILKGSAAGSSDAASQPNHERRRKRRLSSSSSKSFLKISL